MMNTLIKKRCTCTFFISIVLLSHFAPALAYSFQNDNQITSEDRAYNVKSNNIKKAHSFNHKKDTSQAKQPPTIWNLLKTGVYKWANLLRKAFSIAYKEKSNTGSAIPIHFENNTPSTDLKSDSEFSWTKLASLGIQLILSFFGNDNVAMDKMDPGSPLEAFFSAIIGYFTGSNDPNEISAMAKQATELWGIVVSLLDTLKQSFSKRSFEARAIGSNDLVADAAIATTSMAKSYLKSYATTDDSCIQKYLCEANRDCANETSETGYIFCQMATYAVSYALESQVYVPFEILSDAGRIGRLGENCSISFKKCAQRYF